MVEDFKNYMKLRFSINAHMQDTHTYIQILILQFSLR